MKCPLCEWETDPKREGYKPQNYNKRQAVLVHIFIVHHMRPSEAAEEFHL